MDEYAVRQYVGIDLHRRRSVMVRMTPEGERLGAAVRIENSRFELAEQVANLINARGGDFQLAMNGDRNLAIDTGTCRRFVGPGPLVFVAVSRVRPRTTDEFRRDAGSYGES